MATLHVRFDGQSIDMDMTDLDIGSESSDSQIRVVAAASLNVPASKLAPYAVDRNADTGEITLRPQAVFG